MTIYTQSESDRKFKERYSKISNEELYAKIAEWQKKVDRLQSLLDDRLESAQKC